jgi:hypothetical protein
LELEFRLLTAVDETDAVMARWAVREVSVGTSVSGVPA